MKNKFFCRSLRYFSPTYLMRDLSLLHRFMVSDLTSLKRGVLLESSGLRFSSGRSLLISVSSLKSTDKPRRVSSLFWASTQCFYFTVHSGHQWHGFMNCDSPNNAANLFFKRKNKEFFLMELLYQKWIEKLNIWCEYKSIDESVKVRSKFFDGSAIQDTCASKNVEKIFSLEIHGKTLRCMMHP